MMELIVDIVFVVWAVFCISGMFYAELINRGIIKVKRK